MDHSRPWLVRFGLMVGTALLLVLGLALLIRDKRTLLSTYAETAFWSGVLVTFVGVVMTGGETTRLYYVDEVYAKGRPSERRLSLGTSLLVLSTGAVLVVLGLVLRLLL